ncbi:MAG: response regulator transcription factor [Gemmatimonadales bacterium]
MLGLNEVAIRVLLVEDNPAEVDLFREYLEEDPQYQVTAVTTLGDAVSRLGTAPVDVVVLDLSLPDARGVESVERLIEASETVPILVLTGSEDEGLALQCIDAGASDYLYKSEVRRHSLRRSIGFSVSRRHRMQLLELAKVIARLKRLSTRESDTSITALSAGVGPVRSSNPSLFGEMRVGYSAMMEQYLNFTVFGESKPSAAMELLATRLGDHSAGPRDLLDLHLAVLEHEPGMSGRWQSNAIIIEGRLLALEMMGLLVDYYRSSARRRNLSGRT